MGASVNFSRVVLLCVFMYGGIGIMWMAYASIAKTLSESRKAPLYVTLICITWCSTSVGMHMLNKTIVSVLAAPSLCTMAQMAVAVIAMLVTSYDKILAAPRWQVCTWLVVPIFFAAMLGSSFYTYEYISLSLLTVVRNLTPLVVLPIERLVMPAEKQPKISAGIIFAILVMLIGAVTYGRGVTGISVIGISFAVANMVLAISDRLIQRRLLTTECQDLHPSVCTFLNNLFGLFPSLLMAMGTSEIAKAQEPERLAKWHDPQVLMLLAMSGVIGIGICYLGFECQRAISATSFFVLQNVSKIAVVSVGIVCFSDPVTAMTLSGLAFSIGGSFLYGQAQMAMAEADKSKKATEQTSLVNKDKMSA